MLCAISGVAPEVPVASRKSGNVFEKRLIESYISENGTDPVNGEDLTVEDLIELKSSRVVQPRPPTFTSIPSLLSALQNEWDALALESYTLKQQLSQTRQELSTALYQHDAAVRVIARLTQERDESRDALSKLTASGGSAANGDAMQGVISEAVVAKIEQTQQELSSTRRKRPIPEGWADSATVSAFDVVQTTEPVVSGPTSLDVSDELELVGGSDGTVVIVADGNASTVLSVGGKATTACFCGTQVVVGSSTGVVTVFEQDGTQVGQLKGHSGAVTSVSMHPRGDMLASTGADKSWVLYDLTTLATLTQIPTNSALTTSGFHPDGHLFAAGGANDIKMFDLKTGSLAAEFNTDGPVAALSFSENGTWLASATKGSEAVSVWDLRKAAVTKSIEVGSAVSSIKWDYTGQFLAVAGPGCVAVQQYTKSSKAWTEPFRKALAGQAVQWGSKASSLKVLTPKGAVSTLGV